MATNSRRSRRPDLDETGVLPSSDETGELPLTDGPAARGRRRRPGPDPEPSRDDGLDQTAIVPPGRGSYGGPPDDDRTGVLPAYEDDPAPGEGSTYEGYAGGERRDPARRGGRGMGRFDSDGGERWSGPRRRPSPRGDQTGEYEITDTDPGSADDIPAEDGIVSDASQPLPPADAGPLPPRASSAVIGLLAAATAAALALGVAYLAMPVFVALLVVVQVLFALAWAVGVRPSNRWGVSVVALVAGLAADGVMVGYHVLSAGELSAVVTGRSPNQVDFAPVAGILAVTFIVMILVQLGRWGQRRVRVTEAFGSAMLLAGALVALAGALALRMSEGTDLVAFFVGSTGAAVAVAHLADAVLPRPAFAQGVRRGLVGVPAGVVAAAAIGAALAGMLDVPVVVAAGIAAAAGLLGILIDVGQAYAEAGRRQAGEVLAWSLARPFVGPLLALSVATLAAWMYGTVVLG